MTDTINLEDLSRAELEARIRELEALDAVELETKLREAREEQALSRTQAYEARSALETLKQGVTDALRELVANDTLSLEVATEVAEELGVDAPTLKFDVTVMVKLTVTGVEAQDADEAENFVTNAYSVDLGYGLTYDSMDNETDSIESEPAN